MQAQTPKPPTPTKAEATRLRVLSAAAALFADRGYNAVSINDIAEACDLTKGAVYGHFRSKGHLLIEVIQSHFDRYVADVPAPGHEAGEIAAFLAPAARPFRMVKLDAAAAARHDDEVAEGMRALHHARMDRLVAQLAQLQSDGQIAADVDIETLVFINFAIGAGVADLEAIGVTFPSDDRWVATMTKLLSVPPAAHDVPKRRGAL